MQKNTPARKALAPTFWFQHKHPEPGTIGRVTTAKRYQHMRAYAKEMIPNQKIREIILQPIEIKQAGAQIANYLIQKTGNKKDALIELNKIENELLDPLKHRFSLTKEIIKHGKKIKIPAEKMKEYEGQTDHLIRSAHQLIFDTIEWATKELKKS